MLRVGYADMIADPETVVEHHERIFGQQP